MAERVINSTADININHLAYMGIKPGNCADAWKSNFERCPWGHCKVCSHKISISPLIASIICVKYWKKNVCPPVHFLMRGIELHNQYDSPESANIFGALTKKQRVSHIIPVCFKCWEYGILANYRVEAVAKDEDITNLLSKKKKDLTPDELQYRESIETQHNTEYKEYLKDVLSIINQDILVHV